MQDPEKRQEIESLGEEYDDFSQEECEDAAEEKSNWSGALLLQAVICAIAMLILVYFRMTDDGKYQEISQWYQREMSQEIELPQFQHASPQPTALPEPSPSTPPAEPDDAAQQLL